ncbi:sunset domain-containing protein [Microbacterium sp. bgisy189]|uniref:sunset domain-containing protein n=1 Tax=Microbacterium sp. bgisy189 TaxID=3413798 RepID=UPI003EC132AD
MLAVRAGSITLSTLVAATLVVTGAPIAASAAETTGSITGTASGGYVPDGAAIATAYQLVGEEWLRQGEAVVAANGAYKIDGLELGSYRVAVTDLPEFNGTDGDIEYFGWREWWDDAMTIDAADSVELSSVDPNAVGIDIDLDTVEGEYSWPTIDGTPKVGGVLTATPGAWPIGTPIEYAWFADSTYLADATGATLEVSGDLVGSRISVIVSGEKTPGVWEAKDSAATDAVARGTLTGATPKIKGVLAAGSTIKVSKGTWTAGTSFRYQWYADGKKISGATSSSFKLPSTLVGTKITVNVAGSKTGYASLVKKSAVTSRVAKAPTPTISGSAKIGSKLSARAGTWTTGTRLGYQWYANGVAISGATKSTFTVTRAERGKAITVRVRGAKSGYATVAKMSEATRKVPVTSAPKISGSATVGQRLTVKPGTWSTKTAFTYQWYVGGKAIKNATGATFKLKSTYAGKTITVKVTGRKSGYTTVSRTSSATRSVRYPSRTGPTSLGSCPSWAPIKGNADSGIYHLPSGRYYDATNPEECFRTETAARAAGYRASKV